MTRPLVLFGTGPFAEVAEYHFRTDSDRTVAAFTVDRVHQTQTEVAGLPVVAWEDLPGQFPPETHDVFVAVGYRRLNRFRAEVCDRVRRSGYRLASYLSSKATVWEGFELGENTFIFEGNNIQPYTTIGDDVILWSGNHIGHHSRIDDHCFLASHIVVSGQVHVGKRCFIGVNATFRDGITIGDDCIIGAAATVMEDAPAGSVYPGPRTKRIDKHSSEVTL